MNQITKAKKKGFQVWAGPAFPLLAGLLFWLTPLGHGLDRLSYDLLFLFKPAVQPKGVEIIYMDEKSFRELHQQPSDWNRLLHAALLNRLTKDKARLVVFDVWFSDRGTSTANEALREAIKQNGRVVLAAIRSTDTVPGLKQVSLLKPLHQFADVAAGWGIAEVSEGPDAVVRQIPPDSELGPSLSSAAWTATGGKVPTDTSGRLWLNYYGPEGTIPSISYSDVSNQPSGFFRNKVIFIGARPKVLYAFGETEAFRTPYSKWGGALFPGVEILATGYLNLERGESLVRMPPLIALGLITLAGLLLGWGVVRLNLPLAVGIGGGAMGLVLLLALVLQSWEHVWFSWMIVAGIEVPAALAWKLGSALSRSEAVPTFSAFLTHDRKHSIPNVPDHVLIQRIGFGAYGEVWLAKNLVGMFRAVKFVFRDRFSDASPYLQEFSGIKKYMPISLNHPGLLPVLHVGEDNDKRFFFYIMEVGDDQKDGQHVDPAKYVPRNLSQELHKRGQFSVEECLVLGLHLTTALDHLHKNGLIHRDIKPSNIIYVSGVPKLADIGLVTEVKDRPGNSTYIGTTGYIPPEGPGTACGDIYSLGKVVYEVCTGRDRLDFPDLPTRVMEGPEKPGLLEFNEIILKACESDPARRYQSAAEIHADLIRLQRSLEATQKTIVLSFPEQKPPEVPEYELFEPAIGQGAFGKVWLARNAIGQWQALKVVYQANFGNEVRPYDIEFKGIQKYKPISEKHPGLLRVELVSKKKSEGYFYYVMELGDAVAPGWEQDPAIYKPRDLESMRKQAENRRLPILECARIGVALADALDYLHRQGLTHRDIKPSNVIFVSGQPKLADIGLVTDIRPADEVKTIVGTLGYMPPPPERPGTAQADIYALGMLLYVISSGRDPSLFPELSTSLMERSANTGFVRLDAIILKACQPDACQRYQTTGEMLQELQEMAGALGVEQQHEL